MFSGEPLTMHPMPHNPQANKHSESNKNLKTLRILLKSTGGRAIDLSEDAALVLNLKGVVENASPATYTLLGLPEGSLQGKMASQILGIPPLVLPFSSCIKDNFLWNRKDEAITLQYSARSLFEQDMPCGILLTLTDISEERKRSDAYLQAAKFAVIGQVSAGLAHELRNPMTTIKGFMQLITAEQWPGHLRSYHQLILDEIKVIDKILSHFLLLTNPSAPKFAALDLKELAVSATQMLHTSALMAEVNFNLDWPSGGPYIRGDQEQLLHALLSILQNAIEASQPGGVIRLRSATRQDKVSVIVEDDGPGIPRENKQRVFDPFFTTRKGGTGLGLTIAQQIMLAHHGELLIDTPSTSKGTRVTLSFPALHPNTQEIACQDLS